MRQRKTAWERLPAILFCLYWWMLLGFFLFWVDPEVIRDIFIPRSYWPILIVLFGTVLTTMGVIRQNWVKGLVWAIAVSLFMVLRLLGLGNIVNLLLIGGVMLSIEYYWHAGLPLHGKTNSPDKIA